jgi:hypothetical protein
MLTRTGPRPAGNLARRFAAVPFQLRVARPMPVLLPGYLDTAEACARANDCPWCQRELARAATTCAHCGRERFRRFCQTCGPCGGEV